MATNAGVKSRLTYFVIILCLRRKPKDPFMFEGRGKFSNSPAYKHIPLRLHRRACIYTHTDEFLDYMTTNMNTRNKQ